MHTPFMLNNVFHLASNYITKEPGTVGGVGVGLRRMVGFDQRRANAPASHSGKAWPTASQA